MGSPADPCVADQINIDPDGFGQLFDENFPNGFPLRLLRLGGSCVGKNTAVPDIEGQTFD